MANLVHSSSTLTSTLLLGINGEGPRKFSVLTPSASLDYNLKNGLGLEEQNHLGLSYLILLSSEDSAAPTMIKEKTRNLDLDATDLMLGPPGYRSPQRGLELNKLSSKTLSEKPLFPLHPSKDGVHSSSTKSILSENERRSIHLSKDGVHSSSTKCIVSGNEEVPLHPSKDGVHSSSTKTAVSENKRGFSDTIGEFSAQKNSGLLHPSKDGVHSSSTKTTVSGNERGLLHPSQDGVHSSTTKTAVSGNERGFSDTTGEVSVQKNSGLLHPSKDGVHSSSTETTISGNKRGFSDTIGEFSAQKNSGLGEKSWMFKAGQGQSPVKSVVKVGLPRSSLEQHIADNGNSENNSAMEPAAKVQVVGWPPVGELRKTTLTGTSKTTNEVGGRKSPRALFVKVSMDGAPYLRKVDLRSYSTYQELSSSLREMFSCFTLGTCGAQEGTGEEILSESKLKDQTQGSEYVLSYEDKDGDWMLVGDVPWEMFTESCKKLKIMKGSDAIGLAPYAMEKNSKKN